MGFHLDLKLAVFIPPIFSSTNILPIILTILSLKKILM
jgi:hypothetical protein